MTDDMGGGSKDAQKDDLSATHGQPNSACNKLFADETTSASRASPAPKNGLNCTVFRRLLGFSHLRGGKGDWGPILLIGLLLFLVALFQAFLASRIRRKGIQVNRPFLTESKFPIAGNPLVGFLALGVAACFIVLSVLAKRRYHGGCVERVKRVITVYSIIFLVATTIFALAERAVHREIARYHRCTDSSGGTDVVEGDCYCWTRQVENGFVEIHIAHGADVTCSNLLDNVGAILLSYILMIVVMVLTAVGLCRKPKPTRPELLNVILEPVPEPYVVSPTRAQQYSAFSR